MVKRVLVLLIVICVTLHCRESKLFEINELEQEASEEYKQILDQYLSIPTKESKNALRKWAYKVEVKPTELEEIRTEYFKASSSHFISYENMQLVHYYSVILNRYEPNAFYRSRIIMIEYVFDDLLKRKQIQQNEKLDSGIYLSLLSSINLMDESKQEKAINRIAKDFRLYTEESIKQEVYEWEAFGLPFEANASYVAVLHRFLKAIKTQIVI